MFGTFLLGALLMGGAYLGLSAFRASSRPSLILTVRPEALGPSTRITAIATAAGRGLAEVRLELVQGEKVTVLVSKVHAPRPAHAFWGPRTTTFELASLELGREALARLDRGNATLRLVAARAPSWLLAPEPAVREVTLPVRREPPSLSRRTAPVVVSSGGSGVVVYEVGATAVRDGLSAGGRTFPGFPLPGGTAAERFVLFGLPIDVTDRMALVLFAEDEVGNRAEALAVDRIALKAFPADTIVVRDDFLAKVVPEILAHSPEVKDQGDRLQTFLAINNDLRRANAEALDRLAAASVPHFLWSRSFLPLPRSQVMSAFADRRSYVYAGREVDKQVHFGFDLAATRNTDVPAGNDGVVALARYLGIYGNAVVLDHGYGLMSLYAHLSALDVVEGQSVARGDTLGRTGATGLAGGDHLHFTLLVHGIPVNPNEWWDPHWIKDHVLLALGPALPFTE